MNEKEIIMLAHASLSEKEKEYIDVVSYVLIKILPVNKRVKINKRKVISLVKEYIENAAKS